MTGRRQDVEADRGVGSVGPVGHPEVVPVGFEGIGEGQVEALLVAVHELRQQDGRRSQRLTLDPHLTAPHARFRPHSLGNGSGNGSGSGAGRAGAAPYLNRRSPGVAMRCVPPWRFTQSRTRPTELAHCQPSSYSRTPVKAP